MSTKLSKSAAAQLANLLPPKPAPLKAPTVAAKPEPLVDQATVDAFLHAEANVVETAIALFLACCWHRVSPAQFVGRSDAKVRASEFNCARTVAEQAGPGGAKFAQSIIERAAKLAGDRRHNVLAALRSAKATFKEAAPSAIKGAALKAKVAKQATAAADVAKAQRDKKQAEKRATRVPALPKSGTLEAFMPAAMAALMDVQKKFGALAIPKGKLRAAENFTDSLAETIKLAGELNA